VPSIEEIAAISAGRNSKRQMYRLPGGSERIINTKSCTVVNDVIEEICAQLGVPPGPEQHEFSLYCIVEGDPYTMPLNRDEYILDVTTELLKNGQIFYLIFCRSVWHFPLRLDSQLYIEVIFNQVAPDYLEGLLLALDRRWSAEMDPQHESSEAYEANGQKSLVGLPLPDHLIKDLSEIAALLHRAADMEHQPSKDEVKYLLPKPILPMRSVRPARWVELVQAHWSNMAAISTTEAKAQCLDILCRWPLFGSCFFAIRHVLPDTLPQDFPEYILALNKHGAHFLHLLTHVSVSFSS
jgi:myosin-15